MVEKNNNSTGKIVIMVFLTIFLVILFALIGYYIWCIVTSKQAQQVSDVPTTDVVIMKQANLAPVSNDSPSSGSLAEQLSNSGWILYHRDGCSYCDQQKADFGEDVVYLSEIDCSGPNQQCSGITGFPTWKNRSGEVLVGYQSQEDLANIL